MKSVDGTSVVLAQHCTQDLLTTTVGLVKSMDQGKKKEYGPRKGDGEYVHDGDSLGVVMDTTKGELSFVVNGVNLGVAHDQIPLDKPFVPCVVLSIEGNSVELII